MTDDSKKGCLAPLLIVDAIAAVIYFVELLKPLSIYTPGVTLDHRTIALSQVATLIIGEGTGLPIAQGA